MRLALIRDGVAVDVIEAGEGFEPGAGARGGIVRRRSTAAARDAGAAVPIIVGDLPQNSAAAGASSGGGTGYAIVFEYH